MQMIGLIGGMSWESTAVYYRRINEQVRTRLGGLHSADVVMRCRELSAPATVTPVEPGQISVTATLTLRYAIAEGK